MVILRSTSGFILRLNISGLNSYILYVLLPIITILLEALHPLKNIWVVINLLCEKFIYGQCFFHPLWLMKLGAGEKLTKKEVQVDIF